MKKITKEYNLYTINELSKEAQEKALNKHIKGNDYPFLYEDMKYYLETLLEQKKIKETGETKVYYSLSYSQGEGAMFTGSFEWNGYNVVIKHSGYYYHYNSKDIIITDEEGNYVDTDEPKEAFNDIYVSICKDLETHGYGIIEYQDSMECFKESCEANEYTFLEDGTMMNY